MTYREQAEKGRDADPPVDGLRCERCNVPVPRSDDPQCPQCLRRTTVVDPKRLTKAETTLGVTVGRASSIGSTRVVWPYNDLCPICGTRDVGEWSVFLRVSKTASGFGSVSARIVVRVRTCEPCLARVVRLDRLRWVSLAGVMIGMPLILGFFVGGIRGILAGALGTVLFVGALVMFTSKNRRLRAVLDASGLTAQVAELVPNPSGMIEQEHYGLTATPPDHEAIDLVEVLRRARVRS